MAPALVLLLALLAPTASAAHESDYSYLRLQVLDDRITGEWELHRRDARIALGLAGDVEGEPGWAELRGRADALHALLGERIVLATPDGACPLQLEPGFEERPGGRDYLLVHLAARCPAPVQQLRLGYALLFDLDPVHRGFFAVADAHQTHVGVFTATESEVVLDIRQFDRLATVWAYLREGARHIAEGLDHVLFLVALLLPAPLVRREQRWRPQERLAPVVGEVLRIVTAFTVAHSLTLALAVFGAVHFEARWVELAIAVSVFAAAWNNLRPFLPGRVWAMAFGFGLVHGLGFAGALVQLGLPRQGRGLALLGFNVGVECGQLAIVAALLPLLYLARRRAAYETLCLRVGSMAIAWLAIMWAIERGAGIELIPWL